ncbi:MAG: molecular chaperone DnaJ, molecular chaperone DnaJ [archaeon GW2011_AR10]|nr:MAG: molecular chaperone DnaJ, molecular chaperone DnaJ [archaeon GW2011_AR10]
MAKQDYYNVLGVSKNASQEDIKAAYKRLAKQFHPDVSSDPQAEEKFKEVLEAYNVLSDQQKRHNYDQFGHDAERFSGFGGFRAGDFSNIEFDFEEIFSDFGFGRSPFSDIFGAAFGKQGRRQSRGTDILKQVSISFEEAAFGTEKEIEVERIEACHSCSGTGRGRNSKEVNCEACNGAGFQRRVRQTFLGTIATQTTCNKCGGEGKTIKDPCKSCSGNGTVKKSRKIKVKIPAGINSGNHLRIAGEGNAGERNASAGNLFIVVFVEPHEVFKRDGKDIFMEMPLSFSEAALGITIEAPTLKGKAKVRIPASTQTGTIFKLRGQGIKEVGSSVFGDQFIKVIVQTPERMTQKQRKLFEELAEEEGTKNKRDGFFDRLAGKFS